MIGNEVIETGKGYNIRRATLADVQELLTLYFTIYGNSYPLQLGTNREVMKKLISNQNNLWLVAVDAKDFHICGSAVFEVELESKICRAQGFVVHPNSQRLGIASTLLAYCADYLLEKTQLVNSIYTTTRTLSVGPQLVFLQNDFIPMGIFPNAHRLANYETLTLMVRFRKGVLEKRETVHEVPEALGPILKVLNRLLKSKHPLPKLASLVKPNRTGEALEFELIHAPHYVEKKFMATFSDHYDRFYPFHKPNLLMSANNGEVDIYANYSPVDGYCAIITLSQPIYSIAGRVAPLMQKLRDFGVSYIEVMLKTDNIHSLEALLDVRFLPSAIYPAMIEENQRFVDMVVMSRTLEPLDFRGMHIEKSFLPYIDQYIDLWKKMHLEILGVFDEE